MVWTRSVSTAGRQIIPLLLMNDLSYTSLSRPAFGMTQKGWQGMFNRTARYMYWNIRLDYRALACVARTAHKVNVHGSPDM